MTDVIPYIPLSCYAYTGGIDRPATLEHMGAILMPNCSEVSRCSSADGRQIIAKHYLAPNGRQIMSWPINDSDECALVIQALQRAATPSSNKFIRPHVWDIGLKQPYVLRLVKIEEDRLITEWTVAEVSKEDWDSRQKAKFFEWA